MELFRRALEDGDDDAWKAIVEQYFNLVVYWIGPSLPGVEVLAWEAFGNFWKALHGRPISKRFDNVGQLLGYLKACAKSSGHGFFHDPERFEDGKSGEEDDSVPDPVDHIERRLEELARQEFWKRILQTLQPPPLTFQERLVVAYSFKEREKPAELSRRFPEIFSTPGEVSRVVERLLQRLKRRLTGADFNDLS